MARRRVYRVYAATRGQRAERDAAIATFDMQCPPTEQVLTDMRRHAGWLASRWMFRRMRCSGAVLLVLFETDQVAGYGWLQRMKPLRREFWWLKDDGICLGPYWTHPAHRGRGVYGRLLAHSVAECADRFSGLDAFIWADDANVASNRGIEKAGFAALGRHRVVLILGGLFRRHQRLCGS